jgi:hypothetical protein
VTYDAEADPVHGSGWNSAARWGGWHWAAPRGAEHFRRCSFCGSIHPADLAAEPTWRAEWADQKYGWPHKFYVDIPNRDPSALFVTSAQSGGPADRPAPVSDEYTQWVAWKDLSRAQRKIVKRDGWRADKDDHSDYYGFGTRSSHFAKFYTIHLADPAIGDEAKDAIQHRSRLRFRFDEHGNVGWEHYPPPNLPDCACHWSKADGIWSQGAAVAGCRWHPGAPDLRPASQPAAGAWPP